MSIQAKQTAEKAGRGILGNPRKAFLVVHKPQEGKTSADLSKEIESELMKASGDALGGTLSKALGSSAHVIQVQYNPSTISIQANAIDILASRMQENVNKDVYAQHTRPPSIAMSVQLVFDAVNNPDCFWLDRARVSIGAVLQDTAAIAKRATNNPFTVLPQTNGLLTMSLLTRYKRVSFHWAESTFTGEVQQARARYTMFSRQGHPVRSVVQLQILQQLSAAGDSQYWKKAFETCFEDESTAVTKNRNTLGSLTGNTLNSKF